MFQAGPAQSWANCVEYGDDFGTGKKFSLEKYYKMCDELREELLDREDILNMHGKRMAREAKGFDDQLHLMVFEVQSCAESCQLYAGMGLGRVSKKERIQRAENYAAKTFRCRILPDRWYIIRHTALVRSKPVRMIC